MFCFKEFFLNQDVMREENERKREKMCRGRTGGEGPYIRNFPLFLLNRVFFFTCSSEPLATNQEVLFCCLFDLTRMAEPWLLCVCVPVCQGGRTS